MMQPVADPTFDFQITDKNAAQKKTDSGQSSQPSKPSSKPFMTTLEAANKRTSPKFLA